MLSSATGSCFSRSETLLRVDSPFAELLKSFSLMVLNPGGLTTSSEQIRSVKQLFPQLRERERARERLRFIVHNTGNICEPILCVCVQNLA